MPLVPTLFETIRELVAADRYIVGQHAAERLDERGILEWQVVDGLESGRLLVIETPLQAITPSRAEARRW